MAEMFLKLDGIDGESLDDAHKNEIEIKKWGWLTENKVRWDVNQGGQSTKVEVQAIELEKVCDKASVTLYQNCVTGKHIKHGKITCRKNDGEQKVEYMVVTLTDIMISKVQFIGDGDNQALSETVNLSFAEFQLDYKVQNDTGNAAGGAKSFKFNVQRQHGEHKG
jgi:type VI secretion system secreted protein Hcp